jgi:hypothetical protein
MKGADYKIDDSPRLHYRNINNLDIFLRFLLVYPNILNPMYHIQPLNCPTENRMLIVKPWLLACQLKPRVIEYGLTAFSVVMKNWLPFVFGPAFAMLTV